MVYCGSGNTSTNFPPTRENRAMWFQDHYDYTSAQETEVIKAAQLEMATFLYLPVIDTP